MQRCVFINPFIELIVRSSLVAFIDDFPVFCHQEHSVKIFRNVVPVKLADTVVVMWYK